jgi:serine/threonine-protein kinase RsbW
MLSAREISLSSCPESISELETYLESLMMQNKISAKRYPEILITLTEAVNNAIIHGNKNDVKKQVIVQCISKDEGHTFVVQDEGKGFDLSQVPDPTAEDKVDCCGGRGVYIMSQLCDKISFKKNGRVVEMFFKHCP